MKIQALPGQPYLAWPRPHDHQQASGCVMPAPQVHANARLTLKALSATKPFTSFNASRIHDASL